MSKQQYIFTYSILLGMIFSLISAGTSFAQRTAVSDSIANVGADSLENQRDMLDVEVAPGAVESDTLLQKTFFSGVELKVDYGKLLTLWTEFESKYEAGINVRFLERIVVATEFGYAELNPLKAYDNALFYTIKGMYARAGLDYYTAYDPSNFYYLGLRYAMSNFEDEGQFLLDSDYWEDYQEGFGSQDISASWVELVLGTETYLKISKKSKEMGKSKLLIGWNARLRILTDFQNREEPRIYAIPGYGRTFNSFVPAINFYLKYRIGS